MATKNIQNFFRAKRVPQSGKVGSAEKKKLAKKTILVEESPVKESPVKESPVKEELVEVVTASAEIVPVETVREKVDVEKNIELKKAVEELVSVEAVPDVSESDKENTGPAIEKPVDKVKCPAEPKPSPLKEPTKTSKKKSKKVKQETDDDYTPEKSSKKSKRKPKKEDKRDPKQPLITSFIRRSRRVPADMKRKQDQEQLKHYLSTENDEKLEHIVMRNTELKGRGIFAARKLAKGEFVVEYVGDLLSMEEGKAREDEYIKDPSIGSYVYFFCFKGKRYCIDATAESGRYGRLLNHSKTKPNCKTRLVEEPEGIPRLIIEAKVNIPEDTELLYDYGDRSQKALKAHPWLKD